MANDCTLSRFFRVKVNFLDFRICLVPLGVMSGHITHITVVLVIRGHIVLVSDGPD